MNPRLGYCCVIATGLLLPLGSPQITETSLKPLSMKAQAQMAPSQTVEMDEWQEFSSTKGGFSVLMPGKPTEEIQPAKPEAGMSDTHLFMLELDDGVYAVSYVDVRDTPKQLNPSDINELFSSDELFNRLRDCFTENGRLLSERKITLNGHPGRAIEFIDSKEGFTFKTRLYWTNQRLYMLLVGTTPKAGFYPENNMFLDSFKLRTGTATEPPVTSTQP